MCSTSKLESRPTLLSNGDLLYTNDPDADAPYQLYFLARAGNLVEWELENRQMVFNKETR